MQDITAKRYVDGKPVLRKFHQASWSEPLIFELSQPGERGLLPPGVDPRMRAEVGDALSGISPEMLRKSPPGLPEIAQPQVVRHYMRLSQEILGADLNVDVYGMCTMKYSPKINDQVARTPEVSVPDPLQPEKTVQGMLGDPLRVRANAQSDFRIGPVLFSPFGICWNLDANRAMLRAYHEARGGNLQNAREIVTTIFSHPSTRRAAAWWDSTWSTIPPGPERTSRNRLPGESAFQAHRRAHDHEPGGHRYL